MSFTVKSACVIAALFLISMLKSCQEMRLSLFGTTGQGTVTQVMMEVTGLQQRPTGKYLVEYRFVDKDREMLGKFAVSEHEAEATAANQPVPVVYLAGNASVHRVVGRREWWWPLIFLVLLVALIVNLALVVTQAKADVAKHRRFERR